MYFSLILLIFSLLILLKTNFYNKIENGILLQNEDNNYDILPSIDRKNFNNKNHNLTKIFNSKLLFINDKNITNQYIRYIRKVNKNIDNKTIENNYEIEKKINLENFKNREKQSLDYVKLCLEEKLIDLKKFKLTENPLISVILPSYNKEKVIMKSIRSIQNQSLKNIEIIIVDDLSKDNSKIYYKYLLETDPRIRVFSHLKNMGCWRTRIDGFLYSRGKYVIFFDSGDLYSDNKVLEDAYILAEKYNLDSIRMLYKEISSYNNVTNYTIPLFPINAEYNKIVYGSQNIKRYNKEVFNGWGTLWTRLTKSNIFTKGLILLSSNILNIYKNLWEDLWWNSLADEVSYNIMIFKRYAYLYYYDGKGEGTIKNNTIFNKDKMIHEFIYFLYFDLELLPKEDNKKIIINKLRKFNNKNEEINLNCFISKFYLLDNLIYILLNDSFVYNKDKIFLKKILINSKKRAQLYQRY